MGVVQKIFGTGKSANELRAHVENARRALDEAQLTWGEDGSDVTKRAFLAARDVHDEAVAKLRAAEKREADERDRAAREQTARDEAELSKLLSRVNEVEVFTREVEAAAVENARARIELAGRIDKRLAERANDIHRATQLAAKLGRDLKLSTVTINNVINDAKAAIDHAARTSKIDPIVQTTAIELAVPVWVHRGDRG